MQEEVEYERQMMKEVKKQAQEQQRSANRRRPRSINRGFTFKVEEDPVFRDELDGDDWESSLNDSTELNHYADEFAFGSEKVSHKKELEFYE